MNKVNFDRLMQEQISKLNKKEKLLLHSCCAPCSTACIERLKPYFDITVYYYNPNLDTIEEYEHRSSEQEKYCKLVGVDFIKEDFLQDEYLNAVKGLEDQPEGASRCAKCFELRLEKTAVMAKERSCSYFATTLTVSPLKNATLINGIGLDLQQKLGVNYLPTDFKKQGGYLRSIELSKQNELYRQNYCGCKFSKQPK